MPTDTFSPETQEQYKDSHLWKPWMSEIRLKQAASLEELEEFLEANSHRKYLSWDIETYGLEPYPEETVGHSISFDGNEALYIPVRHQPNSEQNLDPDRVAELFVRAIENKILVVYNYIFEGVWIKKYGAKRKSTLNFLNDAMVYRWLYDSDAKKFNLKDSAREICGCEMLEIHEVPGVKLDKRKRGKIDFSLSDPEDACIVGSTRVFTSEGYITVRELAEKGILPTETLSEYGKISCMGAVSRGYKEVYRVKTDTGRSLYATLDHRFRTLSLEGELMWKAVENIQEGDFILCRSGDDGLIPNDSGIDPDFWYAAGFLYGDGARTLRGNGQSWTIAEGDEESETRLVRIFEEQGVKYRKSVRDPEKINNYRKGVVKHAIKAKKSITTLYTFWAELNKVMPPIRRKGAWRAEGVPQALWRSGKKQIGSFLSGLFTTDGGSYTGLKKIVFYTKYRKLAQDVQALLRLLGINSKVNYYISKTNLKRTRVYYVRIFGDSSFRVFQEKVGYGLSRKTKTLDSILSDDFLMIADKRGFPNASTVIMKMFPPGVTFPGAESFKPHIRHVRAGRVKSISEAVLRKTISYAKDNCFDSESYRILEDYLKNNWSFERVLSKTPQHKKMEVFDIINSDTESYISDGAVSHNCLYAAADVIFAFRILEKVREQVESRQKTVLAIEHKLMDTMIQMRDNEIWFDRAFLRQGDIDLNRWMAISAGKVYEKADYTFNINAPNQVGHFLKKLGVPLKEKTKKGDYKANEEILSTFEADYPVIQDYLTYKGFMKEKTTYIDNLLSQTSEEKPYGYLSTRSVGTTTTGRFAGGQVSEWDTHFIKSINPQNIPSADKYAKAPCRLVQNPPLEEMDRRINYQLLSEAKPEPSEEPEESAEEGENEDGED